MKSNRKILFLIALVCMSGNTVFAQNWNWRALNEQSNRLQGKLTGKVFYMPAEGASQQFYHDSWLRGNILLTDGDIFENEQIRYLAYGDELVAYNSNLRQLFIVDKQKVAGFTVNLPQENQEFVKLYFDGFNPGDRYFERLFDGSRKLLAFRSIDEINTDIYRDKHGRLKHSSLKLKTTYYIYSEETGFKKVLPRRSSFLDLFHERKKEVRRLFRKNNLRPSTEKDMIRAFILLEKAGFL